MIKPNVIIALLVVCGLLGAGFFLLESDRPDFAKSENVTEGSLLVKDFNPDTVKVIRIKKDGAEIRLEKKDGNWTLPSHQNRPAKNDRVQALLANVKEAKLQSTRVGSDTTFGLDEKGRIELALETDANKTELFLGRSQESNKSFVRTSATGPVIEVNKPLDTDASARTEGTNRIIDAQHFYDLRIVNLSQDDITEITITRKIATGEEKIRLQKLPATVKPEEKKEPQPDDPAKADKKDEPKFEWWIMEPAKALADEASINSIVSNLSNMNAKAYADNVKPEERGLDKPNAVVLMKTKDGKETTITFGKQEGEEVILQVSGNTETYKAYKFVLENVQKDLKKKEEEKKDAPIAPLVPPAETPKQSEPVIQQTPSKKEPAPAIPAIPSNTEKAPDAKAPPAVPKADEKK